MNSPPNLAQNPENHLGKTIEFELEEARHLLKKIEEVSEIGHWEVDLVTGENKWSAQFFHILGLNPTTPPSTALWLSTIHPEDLEKAILAYQKSIVDGTPFHLEKRIIRPNGEVLYIVTNGVVDLNSEGKPNRFFGIFKDVTIEKLKESELKRSNPEIENILRFSQDLIVVSDEKGNFLKTSKSFQTVLGYSTEEMTGKSFRDFMNPADFVDAFGVDGLDEKPNFKFTNRYLKADGTFLYLDWSTTFDPKTRAFFAIGRDITQLQESKEELRSDRKKITLLLNTSRDLIWAIDREYCLISANQTFLDFMEKSGKWKAEIGDYFLTEKHLEPQYIQFWKSLYDRAFSGETVSFVQEEEIEDKIQYLEIEIKPVSEGDEIFTLACYAKDISRRKKEELHISELVEKLNLAQKIGKIGYWEYNATTNKIFWSDEIYRIWNLETSFIPDFEFFIQSLHPDDRENCLLENMEAIREKRPLDYTHRIVLADGEIKYLHEKGSPLLNEDGSLAKFQGTVQDITEETQAKIALLKKTSLIEATATIIQSLLELSDWQTLVDGSLKLMGETVDADRTYFFKNYKDPVTGRFYSKQIIEWTNGNISSEFENPANQAIFLDDHPDFLKSVYQKKPFSIFTSETSGPTRAILEAQNIKSILQIPLFVEKQFYGFIGFDDCTKNRIWSEDEKNFLKSITTNLSFAIERKQNLDKIQEALESRNSILESIGDGFYAIDTDYTVIYWNNEAEKKTGISREQIVGRSLWEVIEKDKNPAFEKNLSIAFATNLPVHFETFDQWLECWLDVSIYPTKDSLSVFAKDITNRKSAEEQLDESNERLAILSGATHDAIWDWDIETGEHYWGDGFRKLFGIDFEIEGKSPDYWQKRVHPDDYQLVQDNLNNLLITEEKTYFEIEYRFLKADDSYAFVLDKGSVIRDKNGKPVRLVGAMQDISDRKRFEAELIRLNETLKKHAYDLEISNKDLEQFAYVASHDLQEPLRMITSFLGLIEKKYNAILDEKGRLYIHHAVDGARRMRQIILDLLEFSRVGNITEPKIWVESGSLVEEVILFNQKIIKEKKAILHVGKLPKIFCHSSPVVQLFQNLISNAIKYQRPDTIPEVWIEGEDKGDSWEFSIGDNGIGIEMEYQTKIFIIFQRLHQKEQFSGTGIGLAICKKIAEIHGGKIWVESSPQNGSIFFFSIKKS